MLSTAWDAENVRVRNTFIDIDDGSSDDEVPARVRRVTMPNLIPADAEEGDDSDALPVLLGTLASPPLVASEGLALAPKATTQDPAQEPLPCVGALVEQKVRVKNTFIEQEEEPESPAPCRWVTCPSKLAVPELPDTTSEAASSEEGDEPAALPLATPALRSSIKQDGRSQQDRRVSFPAPGRGRADPEEVLERFFEDEDLKEAPEDSPRVSRINAYDTQDLRDRMEASLEPELVAPVFYSAPQAQAVEERSCVPSGPIQGAKEEVQQRLVLSIASAVEDTQSGPFPFQRAVGCAAEPWWADNRPTGPPAEQAAIHTAPAAAAGGAGAQGGRRLRLWVHIYLHMQLPGFDLVPRLIGRGGANMKKIAQATGAKIRIRGRGSGHLEQATGAEAPAPLMVAVTTDKQDTEGFQQAIELVLKELRTTEARFRNFCTQQGLSHEGPGFSIGTWSEGAKRCLQDVCRDIPRAVSAKRAED